MQTALASLICASMRTEGRKPWTVDEAANAHRRERTGLGGRSVAQTSDRESQGSLY